MINLSQKDIYKLLEKANATAALMVRNDVIMLHAGEISFLGFQAFADILKRYWLTASPRGMERYVGLLIDDRYYLIFASFLPRAGPLLGLMYPLQTPLVSVRQGMATFMQSVSEYLRAGDMPNPSKTLEQSLQFVMKAYPQPDPDTSARKETTGWRKEINERDEEKREQPVPDSTMRDTRPIKIRTEEYKKKSPARYEPQQKSSAETAQTHYQTQVDVLTEDIPWVPIEIYFEDETDLTYELAEVPAIVEPAQAPDSVMVEGYHDAWQPLGEPEHEDSDLVSILQEDFDAGQGFLEVTEDLLTHIQLEGNLALEVEAAASDGDTAPISAAESDLDQEIGITDITFYLVPRLDKHYLLGELPHLLRRWMPIICEKFGWQLDRLTVRPDYIKWTLCDFPESIILEMLGIIRKRTSRRIFQVYPELHQGNSTDDFWSTGYLVDKENKDFSTQALISQVSSSRLGKRA